MKFKLSDYKSWRPKIIEHYTDLGINRVLEITTMSGVPLLITYTILMEEFGGFEAEFDKIQEFYKDWEVV